MIGRTVLSLLRIAVVVSAGFLAGCEREAPVESQSAAAGTSRDAILGVWSNDALCKGGLWLGYLPDGDVVHMLDPRKAPSEVCENLQVITAAFATTGRWTLSNAAYRVVLYRDARPVRTAFYKLTDAGLVQVDEAGLLKEPAERWHRIMPGDAKTLEFIRVYRNAKSTRAKQ